MEEVREVKIGGDRFKLKVLSAWEYGEIEDSTVDWSRGYPVPRRRLREVKFLAKSLAEWTLKDKNGRPLAINEENVKRLPEPLFARLMAEFNRLHEPVGAEELLKDFFSRRAGEKKE